MKKTLAVLSISIFLAGCHSGTPAATSGGDFGTGIVGGTNVKKGSVEARGTVMLINQDQNSVCTATLIQDDLLLTAAHCVSVAVDSESSPTPPISGKIRNKKKLKNDPTDTEVPPPYFTRPDEKKPVTQADERFHLVNKNDLKVAFSLKPTEDANVDLRQVIDIRVHEDYLKSSDERNDVALIRFIGKRPKGTLLVSLPTASDIKTSRTKPYVFTAVGYGRTDGQVNAAGNDEGSDVTQDGGIGTLRKTILRAQFSKSNPRKFIVDQTKGHGVCYGDSGGPALIQSSRRDHSQVIVGIASGIYSDISDGSASESYDDCNHKSLYMNVYYYNSWITRNTIEMLSIKQEDLLSPKK